MKFTVQYPLRRGSDPRFLVAEHMADFVATAEQLGYGGIALTDHPAPPRAWLEGGMGHESLDPLTALSFVAGRTTTIRLITYLLVVPYRNPLLAAKQAATADLVSGGRLILAVGAGYLAEEFAALGVPFAERNALLDDAVEVMQRAWRGEDVYSQDRHVAAEQVVQRPMPTQPDGPPIWFGGNSRRARRRAAERGLGWAPLMIDDEIAVRTRTTAIATPADLRAAVAELREMAAAVGRNPDAIDVHVDWKAISSLALPAGAAIEAVSAVRDAGATWVVVKPPAQDMDASREALVRFSREVIAAFRPPGRLSGGPSPVGGRP